MSYAISPSGGATEQVEPSKFQILIIRIESKAKMKRSKATSRKATRQQEKRDRSVEKRQKSTKKRKLNESRENEDLSALRTPAIDTPSSSAHPPPQVLDQNLNVGSPFSSSQGSSDSDLITNQNEIHKSQVFQKYLRDVRSKSIQGSWHPFDYEEAAKQSRYQKIANWLRSEKPKLQQLYFNGQRTGYYKCVQCADRGCLHIVKACTSDVSKFLIQNVKKHFESKAHRENHVSTKLIEFSREWKKGMDIKYLKMMAKHHVSGGIFKSDEFTDIITSWINEVSNTKIDSETVKKEIPDRRTLQRRLDELSIQVKGSLKIQNLCLNMIKPKMLKHVEAKKMC